MAKLITIGDLSSFEAKDKVLKKGEVLCEELESGNILFFPKMIFRKENIFVAIARVNNCMFQ